MNLSGCPPSNLHSALFLPNFSAIALSIPMFSYFRQSRGTGLRIHSPYLTVLIHARMYTFILHLRSDKNRHCGNAYDVASPFPPTSSPIFVPHLSGKNVVCAHQAGDSLPVSHDERALACCSSLCCVAAHVLLIVI
ncbi:unnamed protein product [Calicophoron daubneyi]|uniref:Uncharacterized protein n=1 Tax=Calicophoron daubneyi TaxID=300641 RepID=A0AAV2T411_CALDB